MKTTTQQDSRVSEVKQPQATKQGLPGSILQAYKEKIVQRQPEEEELLQRKPNNTGLPDNLKSGIENLSGYSMDDVKVHYNSSQPATLQAHAYAKGTDIHVAPGQEKHLPHEAWHVVQQKQGRVKPTMQMKGTVPVNDDAGLEKEADMMGMKAEKNTVKKNSALLLNRHLLSPTVQPVLFPRIASAAGAAGMGWLLRNFNQQQQALEDPGQVNPDGRLGAMLAARRFNPHQVGYGVYPAIRLIHGVFGNIGEQQIGRVFNAPEAQELMAAPRNNENNRRLGGIEHDYWQGQRGQGRNMGDEAMIRFGAYVNPNNRALIQEQDALV